MKDYGNFPVCFYTICFIPVYDGCEFIYNFSFLACFLLTMFMVNLWVELVYSWRKLCCNPSKIRCYDVSYRKFGFKRVKTFLEGIRVTIKPNIGHKPLFIGIHGSGHLTCSIWLECVRSLLLIDHLHLSHNAPWSEANVQVRSFSMWLHKIVKYLYSGLQSRCIMG